MKFRGECHFGYTQYILLRSIVDDRNLVLLSILRLDTILNNLIAMCRLEKLGGLERKLVVDDAQGWRMISCIWLHAGVLHLATNMLSLMVVGIGLEQEFGFRKNYGL